MAKSNFPTTREGLYSYFKLVNAYIGTNGTRLQVNPADITALTTLMGDAVTAGTYLFLWPLYANKKVTRTTDITNQLTTVEKAIKKLLCKIYDDIPGSLWTNTDRGTFDRKKGARAAPTHPNTPIAEQCIATVIPIGGGDARLTFKASHDASKPAKVKNADSIEIAYKLVPQPAATTDASGATVKPRKTMINSPDDGTTKIIFTRASSVAQFGTDGTGMDIQFFARWHNTKHPVLSGSWTGPFSHTLL